MFAYLRNFKPLYKKNETQHFSIRNCLIVLYFIASTIIISPTVSDLYSGLISDDNIRPGHDFIVFHNAGILASTEHFSELYLPHSSGRKSIERSEPVKKFNYPPPSLLLFAPLSTFSYKTAYVIWIGLPCLLLFYSLFLLTRSYLILSMVLVSPLLWRGILTGQTGILCAAIFAYSFYAYREKRPIRSGFSLGILILKPHLIIALPLCLLLTKEWRIIAGGVLSAVSLTILSYLIFGPEAWTAFFQSLGGSVLNEMPSIGNLNRSLTVWNIFIVNTNSYPIAIIASVIGAIFAIICTGYIWKNSTDIIPRAMSLILFPAFISPYFHVYDTVSLLIVFALAVKTALEQKYLCRESMIATLIWVLSFSIFRIHPMTFHVIPVLLLIALVMLATMQVRDKTLKPVPL